VVKGGMMKRNTKLFTDALTKTIKTHSDIKIWNLAHLKSEVNKVIPNKKIKLTINQFSIFIQRFQKTYAVFKHTGSRGSVRVMLIKEKQYKRVTNRTGDDVQNEFEQ